MKQYTPENITTLKANEVFVFGSNLAGHHEGGAARLAYNKFGAQWGIGVGMQGNSYAIPTMQGGVETIKPYVDEFISFADRHPNLTFYVTRIGCGIAGFTDEDIAPLFDMAFEMNNVILPETFHAIINHMHQLESETNGLTFHYTPIKFSDEDILKMESMTLEEKNDYITDLRKQGKYLYKEVTDFIQGSLMAGAAGDALGYEVEFMNRRAIQTRFGENGITKFELNSNGKALISDDTQMTLFTANGLLMGLTRGYMKGIGGRPEKYVDGAYLDWYYTQTGKKNDWHYTWLRNLPELAQLRAPGNTCLNACESLLRGEKVTNNSKGCGGIMRVAPMALLFAGYASRDKKTYSLE